MNDAVLAAFSEVARSAREGRDADSLEVV